MGVNRGCLVFVAALCLELLSCFSLVAVNLSKRTMGDFDLIRAIQAQIKQRA